MTEESKVMVRQNIEWGRLRSIFKGSLESLYLPPYNPNTATTYEAIPGLVPILKEYAGKGERAHLKDVLPKHYEDMVKTHSDLNAIYKKFGIETFDIKQSNAIENYFGFTQAGYWSATPESCYKVIGNVLLEMGLNDTVMVCGPNGFGFRDYVEDLVREDPGMHWLAMPPAMPMSSDQGQGPGPWTTGADMKLIENKTVVIGIGVHDTSEVDDLTKERSATNEIAVKILNRMFEPYGWKFEAYYYKTTYGHHSNFGAMSVIRPGLAVVAPNVIIGGLPPSMKKYEIIELVEEEAAVGGVNVLPIDVNNAVTCKAAPRMNEALSKRGVAVHEANMTGTVRYGAGPQCNVIAINRDDV